ncbi:MAG: hypothetical protein HC804_06720, partial [Anaerolineae bacterium]|nr:hypothetical protein [Anaerolineae bacterium]
PTVSGLLNSVTTISAPITLSHQLFIQVDGDSGPNDGTDDGWRGYGSGEGIVLRRFGVPFWALTYVIGHNDMDWYRIVGSLGRHDIVGITVKIPQKLPEHLLANEKHAVSTARKFILPPQSPKILCWVHRFPSRLMPRV